jgi:hypothetical protein
MIQEKLKPTTLTLLMLYSKSCTDTLYDIIFILLRLLSRSPVLRHKTMKEKSPTTAITEYKLE